MLTVKTVDMLSYDLLHEFLSGERAVEFNPTYYAPDWKSQVLAGDSLCPADRGMLGNPQFLAALLFARLWDL